METILARQRNAEKFVKLVEQLFTLRPNIPCSTPLNGITVATRNFFEAGSVGLPNIQQETPTSLQNLNQAKNDAAIKGIFSLTVADALKCITKAPLNQLSIRLAFFLVQEAITTTVAVTEKITTGIADYNYRNP